MVDGLVQGALAALGRFESFNQEQVDHIVKKASLAALGRHGELARLAVEETGRGLFEDKAVKNPFACERVVNSMRGLKTAGVIRRDELNGITEIAEPVGVVCAMTPVTNPTSTTLFKAPRHRRERHGQGRLLVRQAGLGRRRRQRSRVPPQERQAGPRRPGHRALQGLRQRHDLRLRAGRHPRPGGLRGRNRRVQAPRRPRRQRRREDQAGAVRLRYDGPCCRLLRRQAEPGRRRQVPAVHRRAGRIHRPRRDLPPARRVRRGRRRRAADPRLWLLRPQLGVRQRERGEAGQHQADRTAQQQHAVVQDPAEDLLRAQLPPLPRRDGRHRPRLDRHRQDDRLPRLRAAGHRHPPGPRRRGRRPGHRQRRAQPGAGHRPGRRRADARVPARHDHRPRRRLPDGRREDHVADVRASGGGVRGHEGEVLRHPQLRLHVPLAGREGEDGRHPDHLGHRLRGHPPSPSSPTRPRPRSTRSPTTRSPRTSPSSTRPCRWACRPP